MGYKFVVGEQVIIGKYYQKWGTSYSTYVLLKDSHVVFLYSHLVQERRFLMIPKDYCVQGNDLVYEFPNDATIGLKSTLATFITTKCGCNSLVFIH
jgi:hypothetical protein